MNLKAQLKKPYFKSQLNALRKEIDDLDLQIIKLFSQRMKVAYQIDSLSIMNFSSMSY